MLHKNDKNKNDQMQIFSMEQLVPKEHILRKIDECIDFEFIYDLVSDKYSLDNGRPSIDPIVLFKLTFLQYLFNIKSMRQTIKEVEVNVAYRWFLGLDFYDDTPHFTTFSQNYRRRFKNTNIFNQIFAKILEQAVNQGFVDSQMIFVDSTHVKAHANRHKVKKVVVKRQAKSYQEELDREINEDRREHGKKDLKPPKNPPEEETEITKSTTDPESGLFHKGEHKEVFAYEVQTGCDKNGWVLGYKSFPGNLHDSTTFIPFYEEVLKQLQPKKIVMDAGYKTPAIAKQLIDDSIQPVLPYTRPTGKPKLENPYYKREFIYDEYYDSYICPENQELKYSTTNRDGYREYKSNPKKCIECPNLKRCTGSKIHQKTITRHVWQNYIEECEEYRYTSQGKIEYEKRKETIERTFGTAKEYHGFRYTNMRGLQKMDMKAALTFTCMNMKKLAILMSKLGLKKPTPPDLYQKIHNKFLYFIKNIKPLKNFRGLSSVCLLYKRFKNFYKL